LSRIVLSLCDKTGNMVRPWAEAGYVCYCVDIQHEANGLVAEEFPSGGMIVHVNEDIRTYLPPRSDYAIVFAFPPCTHLARRGCVLSRKRSRSSKLASESAAGRVLRT
jgi:hypothetical protein